MGRERYPEVFQAYLSRRQIQIQAPPTFCLSKAAGLIKDSEIAIQIKGSGRGVQRVHLHPHPKTWGANISFCIPKILRRPAWVRSGSHQFSFKVRELAPGCQFDKVVSHTAAEPVTKQNGRSEGLPISERALCRFREGAVRLSKGPCAGQRALPSDKEGLPSVKGQVSVRMGPPSARGDPMSVR